MERNIYNINHLPVEYISAINIICNAFNIIYRIFQIKEDVYKADIFYNETRYTGTETKGINKTLIDLYEQIRYILCKDMTINISEDTLETLEYIIYNSKLCIA